MRKYLIGCAMTAVLIAGGCGGGGPYLNLKLTTKVVAANRSDQPATFVVSTFDPQATQNRTEIRRWDGVPPQGARTYKQSDKIGVWAGGTRLHICVTARVGGQTVAEDCTSVAYGDTATFAFDGTRINTDITAS